MVVVLGKGSEIGDYLTQHPAVNCISFTGGDTGISVSKKVRCPTLCGPFIEFLSKQLFTCSILPLSHSCSFYCNDVESIQAAALEHMLRCPHGPVACPNSRGAEAMLPWDVLFRQSVPMNGVW